jgi:hypothetical protein
MCLLSDTNWVFIPQQTAFFIVPAVKPSNLTYFVGRSPILQMCPVSNADHIILALVIVEI